MAWKRKSTVDTTTSIPLGRLARPSEISSYIKKLIKASQYDYHESEAFEVKEVILNEPLNRGSVTGNFINDPRDICHWARHCKKTITARRPMHLYSTC